MNLLVCGVGGQGVLLFSDIVSNLALNAGLQVKKSEVHGMSQRGGSVTSHVRYGPRVFSPLIEEGTADMVVAFEKLEALRWIHFLTPKGRLLFDPHRIEPLPVQLGLVESLPDKKLDERLAARAPTDSAVPAHSIARQLGNPRVQNMVMLGAASHYLEFPVEACTGLIRSMVKPQFVDLNLKAFAAGREAVKPA